MSHDGRLSIDDLPRLEGGELVDGGFLTDAYFDDLAAIWADPDTPVPPGIREIVDPDQQLADLTGTAATEDQTVLPGDAPVGLAADPEDLLRQPGSPDQLLPDHPQY